MPSQLFKPIKLRGLELSNRIIVSPMCQYSAINGDMTDWHLMHLGQLAVSGSGLVFVEATGVEAAGRISPGCLSLCSDENEAAMRRVVEFFNNYGNASIGIQLAHAGRKASTDIPWRGGLPMTNNDPNGWETFAPSAIPFDEGWPTPTVLDEIGLDRVRQAFIDAAIRAVRVGYHVIEMHCAHGYLLHQFLSPLTNQREDDYGGDLKNRMRFPLDVFKAVRAVCPDGYPVGVRVSATDWVDGGWDLESTIAFARKLRDLGCDFIDVSSGGNSPEQRIIAGPGYQTGFASAVRQATGLATIAVGQITDPHQAETILGTGQADMVALARGILYDPRWPWHAAKSLRAKANFSPQYMRANPLLKGEHVKGSSSNEKK